MSKLIGVVLVLLVVGGVADVAARSAAEAQIEATVSARLDGAVGVSASIGSFPFLPSLLTSGRAGDVSVSVDRLTGRKLELVDVAIEADAVVVDRDGLIPALDIQVTGVDEARITALIAERELSRSVGLDLDIAPGTLAVTVAGARVVADARVEGESLVLGLGRLPERRVALPRSDLLPCTPTLRLVDDALEISCTADEVPPALLEPSR